MTAALPPDTLYDLLPVVHRLRDEEQGLPLRALLRVVTEQADLVKRNIDRLWDDLAIETCQEWVISYIGDLVGNNLLHDAGARTRVDVARTIFYRRRKGTLPVLERLAGDVTGWGCHAVEFFQLLAWAQHLNHLRPGNHSTPDLRDLDLLDRLDGPFDEIAHTADLRPPSSRSGWHNLPNVGFFLYRLRSYPLRRTQAARSEAGPPGSFHFSSLGIRTPLFTGAGHDDDEAGLVQEASVPGPIRPLAFRTTSDFVGKDLSLAVYRDADPDSEPVPADQVICMDLSTWASPPDDRVGVDVRLGRLSFASGQEPTGEVTVFYHYGFSDDTGGGPYDRRRQPATGGDPAPAGADTVANPTALGTLIQVPSPGVDSIQDAVDLWRATSGNPPTVIQVEDDRTYVEDVTIPMLGDKLVVQAANRRRPTLIGRVRVSRDNPAAALTLDGLLVGGWVQCTGDLGELRLRHCTLVPGRTLPEDDGAPATVASLVVDRCESPPRVVLERCLTGPLRVPEESPGLLVADGIVDGLDGPAVCSSAADDRSGPPAEPRRVTMLGAVHVRRLDLASEVIFTGPVIAERTGEGCVRFSFVPRTPGTRVPRRYRCQPDLALTARARELGKASDAGLPPEERALVANRVRPVFTSVRYGDPGYGQLGTGCPTEITTGAEDGSEMGAFGRLRQPQRETNLRIRLDEYLPFGLHPALIYVT